MVYWTARGGDNACKTTMLILERLSRHSWNAKALLALAAFALNYKEFLLLHQIHSSDQLAKLDVILTCSWLKRHKEAIVEINDLMKTTLDVIECIFKLENLSASPDTKDLPELSIVMGTIEVDVYWAIKTVVACMTQMRCLIKDE